MNNVKIIQNFLQEELYYRLYGAINRSNLNWCIGEELYEDDILLRKGSYKESQYKSIIESNGFYETDNRFDIQNVIMFRDNHNICARELNESPIFWEVLEYINDVIKIKVPLRMKLNMTFCNDVNRVNGFHTDIPHLKDTPHKTAVLYLNDNNGGTLLEDGTFIKSEANKFVMFDGNINHAPVTQTDTKKRFVLNYNFIL